MRSVIHFSFPTFTVSVKCARHEENFCEALESPIVKTEWSCAPGWGVYPQEDGTVLVLISGIKLYLTEEGCKDLAWEIRTCGYRGPRKR